jgi:hypothetical protein
MASDPRTKIWRILTEAIADYDDKKNAGKLCGHPIGLLTADPPNLDALCGWESVVVLKWLGTAGRYLRSHRVAINIWGRDDYTVAQVAACLMEVFRGHGCMGMSSQFGGVRNDGEVFFGFITLEWSD